jgi:hypothetical protein
LQINFINYVVTPLWHALFRILPSVSDELKENLATNLGKYQAMLADEVEEEP